MKAEQINGTFRPVMLTLETQEEVNQLWAIFNYASIVAGTRFDVKNPLEPFAFHPDRRTEFDKLKRRLR